MQRAVGRFSVELQPEAERSMGDATLGRYSISKIFSGDLTGESVVLMVSGGSKTTQAGAYAAIERVEGRLKGRQGSFLLIHRGLRTGESQTLEVSVVPGCGTEELKGLEGVMQIRIEGEDHFYEFDYEIKGGR